MNIHIAKGSGKGPTTLSAFDSALNQVGIANYNLLRLSSVIPPNAKIVEQPGTIPSNVMPGQWGDRLYVVMAEMRTDVPGSEVWAGIGWVQEEGTNKGLFVEHESHSESQLRTDITQSLQTLMKTRNVDFGNIHMVVTGKTCEETPVCAMVVAVFQSSDWDNAASFCA